MPTMLSEVYDALREAGATEEKARAAAAAVAQSDTRFAAIDGRLTRIESRLDRVEERLGDMPTKVDFAGLAARFAGLETRLTRWMLAMAAFGGLAGGIVAVVARLVKFI